MVYYYYSTCIIKGFYDISSESVEQDGRSFRRMHDRDVSGENRDAMEARERKKDREKQKKRDNDPIAIMQMNKCVYCVVLSTCILKVIVKIMFIVYVHVFIIVIQMYMYMLIYHSSTELHVL